MAIYPDDPDYRPPRRFGWGVPALVAVLVLGAGLGYAGWRENRQRERHQLEAARADAQAAAEAARDAARRRDTTGGGMFGGLVPLAVTPADPRPVMDRLGTALVGVWAGGGREIEYRADGTFRDGEQSGTWKAAGLTGTKVLAVERTGGGPARVRVTFEGDELLHDGPEPGTVLVLRRKG